MKFLFPLTLAFTTILSTAWSFQPAITSKPRFARDSTITRIVTDDKTSVLDKVKNIFANAPTSSKKFATVNEVYPGAVTNQELATKVVSILDKKGFSAANTLLATSLCCDELARRLEDDFVNIYGNNFNLGGLAGFPFAGNTGFGAMAAHIPDDGYCLLIYGPHVGIAKDGTVGKVERAGIELIDNCCGSAIAASNYLKGITEGGAQITTKIQEFTDFQQGAVQELILPHGKRLSEADDRMAELPRALYESQDILVREIVQKGAAGTKGGIAILGGLQINTAPDTSDYFLPLRFDFMNTDGDVVEEMLDQL
jgi:hypothetical protein